MVGSAVDQLTDAKPDGPATRKLGETIQIRGVGNRLGDRRGGH
jgi:hypothetical protein